LRCPCPVDPTGQGHQLAAFRPYEHLQPVLFEELMSVGDAFEDVAGVDRLKFQAAEGLLQVFTNSSLGGDDTMRPNLNRAICARSQGKAT
jgi:hypothetical protein